MEFRIRKGKKGDAEFIALTIMEAIGEELCEGLAGEKENIHLVKQLFTELAAMENSQYSYTNSLIAESDNGETLGAIIAYDGARLIELRKDFIKVANRLLNWNVTEEEAEEWEPECSADEIYLDSLYVKPAFRREGIATSLINAVFTRFKGSGKPFGILVEKNNRTAKDLYEKLGFRFVGVNKFCGEPMYHLQKFSNFVLNLGQYEAT